jgi:hypothetical protein
MPGRVHDPARFTVQGRTRQRPVVEGRHGGQRGCRALRLMQAPGKENAAPAGKMGSEPFLLLFSFFIGKGAEFCSDGSLLL